MKSGHTRDERRRADRLARRDQRRLEDQAVELAVLVAAEREALRRLEQRTTDLRERRRETAPVRAPDQPDETVPMPATALEPPAARPRPRDRRRAELRIEPPPPRRNRATPIHPARDRKAPLVEPPPRRSAAKPRPPKETPTPRREMVPVSDDKQNIERIERRTLARRDQRRDHPIDEPPPCERASRTEAGEREAREAKARADRRVQAPEVTPRAPSERPSPPIVEERPSRTRTERKAEPARKEPPATPPIREEGARDRPARFRDRERRTGEGAPGAKTRRRRSLEVEAQAVLRAAGRKTARLALKARLFTAQTAPPRLDQDPSPVPTDAPSSPETPTSLGRLRTSGGFIVDENGGAVGLRGVNVRGLDDCAPAAGQSVAQALSLDSASLTQLTDLWGVNLVRLPFRAETLVAGTASMAADTLLLGVDDLVAQLADGGVYTLLALEAPPSNAPVANAFPDPTTMTCWSMLASRYSDRPYVLFELFAPPAPFIGDWRNAALTLVGLVRQAHPASLLFVGDGGKTLGDQYPLLYTNAQPAPNLVYALRVGALANYSASDEAAIAAFARSFPLVATDWSSGTSSEFDRSGELVAAVFGRSGIGWAASSWNAEPRLVIDSKSENLTSTRWGGVVQRAMAMPLKQPLTKLLSDEAPSG